jgi:hypothetical protein
MLVTVEIKRINQSIKIMLKLSGLRNTDLCVSQTQSHHCVKPLSTPAQQAVYAGESPEPRVLPAWSPENWSSTPLRLSDHYFTG